MTPLPAKKITVPLPQLLTHGLYTPREAARRLYLLCDELEQRQVPTEVVAEVRALSERFTRHLQELPVFCERLERLAQSMRP
jgi:hypothetical protein